MPIQLRRLENETDLYHKSLLLREDKVDVDSVLALRASVTLLSKERDSFKYRLCRGLEKSKSRLKELEAELALARKSLQEAAWKLPNWVDQELIAGYADVKTKETTIEDFSIADEIPEDPLFCIGGYEELGGSCVLVGPGSQLASSLLRHSRQSLQSAMEKIASEVTCWDVPYSIKSIEASQFHEMFGCCSNCAACRNSKIETIADHFSIDSFLESIFCIALKQHWVMTQTWMNAKSHDGRIRNDDARGTNAWL
jgi:hypothetical protein